MTPDRKERMPEKAYDDMAVWELVNVLRAVTVQLYGRLGTRHPFTEDTA